MARGIKTGGRQKGTANKATSEIREAFAELLAHSQENMLDWIQRVAATNPEKAIALTIAAAEFVIPKLGRIDHTGKIDHTHTVREEDNAALAHYNAKHGIAERTIQ